MSLVDEVLDELSDDVLLCPVDAGEFRRFCLFSNVLSWCESVFPSNVT